MISVERLSRTAFLIGFLTACLAAGALARIPHSWSAVAATRHEKSRLGPATGRSGSAEEQILFPKNRTTLESGRLELLALSATEGGADKRLPLLVDGKPYNWEPFRPPTLVARLSLGPGEHSLLVGRQLLTVYVTSGEDGGPEGWPLIRNHPGQERGWQDCSVCHSTAEQKDGLGVSASVEFKTCFVCHDPVNWSAAHAHPEEPLRSCENCHSVHASTMPALLIAPARKLCSQCHES